VELLLQVGERERKLPKVLDGVDGSTAPPTIRRIVESTRHLEFHRYYRDGTHFVESLTIPRLPADGRPITVFLGPNVAPRESLENAFSKEMASGQVRVHDATRLGDLNALRAAVQEAGSVSRAVIFNAHGNPALVEMGPSMDVRGPFFEGIDLSQTLLAIFGCNTGSIEWTERMFGENSSNRHLVDQPVAPGRQLSEVAMQLSGAPAAIGNAYFSDQLADLAAMQLLLDGGGQVIRETPVPQLRALLRLPAERMD
jgi:hypothetical protein